MNVLQGTTLVYPFPLDSASRGKFVAQLVIPADMTRDEADRLCAFIASLAAPSGEPQYSGKVLVAAAQDAPQTSEQDDPNPVGD
jgi:hypothetical protein